MLTREPVRSQNQIQSFPGDVKEARSIGTKFERSIGDKHLVWQGADFPSPPPTHPNELGSCDAHIFQLSAFWLSLVAYIHTSNTAQNQRHLICTHLNINYIIITAMAAILQSTHTHTQKKKQQQQQKPSCCPAQCDTAPQSTNHWALRICLH